MMTRLEFCRRSAGGIAGMLASGAVPALVPASFCLMLRTRVRSTSESAMKSQIALPPCFRHDGTLYTCAMRPHPITPRAILLDGASLPRTLAGTSAGTAPAASIPAIPLAERLQNSSLVTMFVVSFTSYGNRLPFFT